MPIPLVSGATKTLHEFPSAGVLVVPKAWNDPRALALRPGMWAADNGAFSGFDEGAFVRMLERHIGVHEDQVRSSGQGCLFVTAPDVVADAASTLARWPFWSRLIRGLGFPVAFVLQDGLHESRIPWDEMDAVFVGGSTAYKESREVRSVCGYAKARGLWVHWGRVNSRRRYELALMSGADSFDGSSMSIAPRVNLTKALETWPGAIASQPILEMT